VQRQKVDYWNSPEADKLAQIKANVEATKGIMMENLDKLLERGEKIDILVQKTTVMVKYLIPLIC
jgi:vesicle-associated membrane protein 7